MPKYRLMNRRERDLLSFLRRDHAYLGIPQPRTYVPLNRQPRAA